ncbi:MAG: glycerophosphodiester phosphodiesterase [Nocardioides sp.]|uniref:glycerophosphodiester phosphodiesterase n=1 Tax=Nocardioides sp. TaxID=35761 RepID=UPI003F018998
MSRRPTLAAALAIGLIAPAAFLAPSQAAPGTAARAGALLTAKVAQAVPGERVTFTAKPPTSRAYVSLSAAKKRKASLVLQRRTAGVWKTLSKVKVAKKVTFTSTVPTTAKGAVVYRTRAVVGKKQYAAGQLRLPVVQQRLTGVADTTDADADQSYTVTTTPARAGRTVTVERYLDGAWTTVATGTTGATGAAVLSVPALYYPAWYRTTAQALNGIPATQTTAGRTTLSRTPTEIAHRAGAGLAPEQTLAAVNAAIDAGAPGMEVDVQLTSDGKPIIVHDATFKRTTNVATVFPGRENNPVGSFTLDEVKQLDAGSWFGAAFAGQQIPTLDEVIDEIDGRAQLVLEVKFHPNNTGTPEQVSAMRAVLDEQLATGKLGALAGAGMLTVSSFNHAFLQPFAEAHPEVPVGALTTAAVSEATLLAWKTWAEGVHANLYLSTRADVDRYRAHGLRTSLWTSTTIGDHRRAVAAGADLVISDYPGRLTEVLDPPAPPVS